MSHAQSVPKPASQSDICSSEDDDEKPAARWKRFAFEGACIELSGSLSATWQKQKAGANAVSVLNTGRGSVSGASEVKTGTAEFRIDTSRKTGLGELKTGFAVKYEKASSDTTNGAATLDEGIVTFAGIKAGYTDSQMNFWDGDFQFSATAPQRTVGLAGYEFKPGEDWTFTLAYETGLPATQQNGAVKFVTVYPDNPVASARLYYEAGDVSFQVSGIVRELRIDGTHPLLEFLGRRQQFRETGWALTGGLTLPVKWGNDGNALSMQATRAVNASPYLGTNADLSSLASTIPVPVTTAGWSAVASYHHVWSDRWESNVMASYLALDISLPRASPSLRTERYAANLIWKPAEEFKIGGEVGYVKSEIDIGGPAGLLRGVGGKGVAWYLFASRDF